VLHGRILCRVDFFCKPTLYFQNQVCLSSIADRPARRSRRGCDDAIVAIFSIFRQPRQRVQIFPLPLHQGLYVLNYLNMDNIERENAPTHLRTMKGGKSVSLNISMSKNTKDDKGLARMIYSSITINGAQFCRPHLKTRCHLCEVDHSSLNDDGDEERETLNCVLVETPS
jgi:hypothetical protein